MIIGNASALVRHRGVFYAWQVRNTALGIAVLVPFLGQLLVGAQDGFQAGSNVLAHSFFSAQQKQKSHVSRHRIQKALLGWPLPHFSREKKSTESV